MVSHKESVLKGLQELFAHMLLTKRKYSDPTAVLKSLSSENGKEITIGNQEDPTGTDRRLIRYLVDLFLFRV